MIPQVRKKLEKNKIRKFRPIFFPSDWRLAAGAFFLVKNDILWEKNNFPQLAACRRRFFCHKIAFFCCCFFCFCFLWWWGVLFFFWKRQFSSAGGLPQAPFFWSKMAFFERKKKLFWAQKMTFFCHSCFSKAKTAFFHTSLLLPL